MSYARVYYTPTGGTDYSVPFVYQDQSEVKVEVNGVAVTSYTWLSPGTIRFNTAPTYEVLIYRDTAKTNNKTVFVDGVVDNAASRNLEDTQLLYSTQEAYDLGNEAIGIDHTTGTTFTARFERISNVADPTLDQDAVTKKWVIANTISNDGSGQLDAHNLRIINVASPSLPTDAANKASVDAAIAAAIDEIGGPTIFDTTHVTLLPTAAPAAPVSGYTLYVDAADGGLKAKYSGGSVLVLAAL